MYEILLRLLLLESLLISLLIKYRAGLDFQIFEIIHALKINNLRFVERGAIT